MGHPGFVLRPLVTGPDAIPIITDEQVAREDPELAVLSVMALQVDDESPAPDEWSGRGAQAVGVL